MHFVFSPIGSAGDVHPMLGVALELRRRGHAVTFLANGYFGKLFERFDVPCVELGSREQFLAAMQDAGLWHPTRAFKTVVRLGVVPLLREQYARLAELAKTPNTVAVASCLGLGALLAQEKLGLPLVTLHLQPAVIWSDEDPPVLPGMFGPRWLRRLLCRAGERLVVDPTIAPVVNRFRRELGLAPVRRIVRWWHSPQCVVCLFPAWFAAPQADWPKNLTQTDFPLWDERTDSGLPPDAARFLDEGDPPIVFTPGSANVFGRDFFQAAVEACAQLGRRGILLTRFPEQLPRSLPAAVRHLPYVPFSQLLPRAAALVHHGGIGTMAQGLAAGIPQLIMPLAHDEFDNASRVKRLDAGDWLGVRRFRGAAAAARLDALLRSARVAEGCRTAAERLSSRGGASAAADAIEGFARRTASRC